MTILFIAIVLVCAAAFCLATITIDSDLSEDVSERRKEAKLAGMESHGRFCSNCANCVDGSKCKMAFVVSVDPVTGEKGKEITKRSAITKYCTSIVGTKVCSWTKKED